MSARKNPMDTKLQENPEKRMFRIPDLRQGIKRIMVSEYFVLYLSILWFIVMLPVIPNIASSRNLNNIFDFIWPLLAVCVGQTLVLLIAGIDLSQISVIGMTSVIGALFMSNRIDPNVLSDSPLWGTVISENGGIMANSMWAVPVGILMMLLVGSLIGLINGYFIAKLKMPPFMVTLVTQLFVYNLAIFLTKSNNIIGIPKAFTEIGKGKIGFIPVAMIITIVLCVLSQLLLSKTVLGKWIYAVGSNVKASVVSGVPRDGVIMFVYAFSGFCAAFASVIYSGRLEMGRPTLGQTLLMDIVGATIIGGTSMFGGKGKVLWTFFGVLFFVLLTNVLNLFNLDTFTINIVKGLIILLAALFDVIRTKIQANDTKVEKAGA
ncbi:MAG: ABC transporter permease [Clostridia bacterium]|nr:ABC transporter permease [Clostridia bacterium]